MKYFIDSFDDNKWYLAIYYDRSRKQYTPRVVNGKLLNSKLKLKWTIFRDATARYVMSLRNKDMDMNFSHITILYSDVDYRKVSKASRAFVSLREEFPPQAIIHKLIVLKLNKQI